MLPSQLVETLNNTDQILWSTLFGAGPGNQGNALAHGGDFLYLAGTAIGNWTFVNFAPITSEHFETEFDPNFNLEDAGIARFNIPITVGVEENQVSNNQLIGKVDIFPIPSSGMLYLNHPFDELQVELMDVSGRRVASFGDVKGELDLSLFPPGVYVLRMFGDGSISNAKIIKQ